MTVRRFGRAADIDYSDGLRAALVARYADGEEHSVWAAVADVGHLIPPQIAIRRVLRNRLRDHSLTDRVEEGRRRTIALALRTLGAEMILAERAGRNGAAPAVAFRLPHGEYGVLRGERCLASVLTAEKVRAIRAARADGVTIRAIAAEHGVAESTIWALLNGKTWRSVE